MNSSQALLLILIDKPVFSGRLYWIYETMDQQSEGKHQNLEQGIP